MNEQEVTAAIRAMNKAIQAVADTSDEHLIVTFADNAGRTARGLWHPASCPEDSRNKGDGIPDAFKQMFSEDGTVDEPAPKPDSNQDGA